MVRILVGVGVGGRAEALRWMDDTAATGVADITCSLTRSGGPPA